MNKNLLYKTALNNKFLSIDTDKHPVLLRSDRIYYMSMLISNNVSLLYRATALTTFLIIIMPATLLSKCLDGDCRNGTGRYRYSNGDVYTGKFWNGRPHGRGVCRYSGGEVYSGMFDKGIIHGNGVYTFPGSEQFSGSFLKGTMQFGTYTFNNGDKYTGWFFKGKKNGEGTYYYANGYRYEGLWENDLKHGPGAVYHGKNLIVKGIWVHGRLSRKS